MSISSTEVLKMVFGLSISKGRFSVSHKDVVGHKAFACFRTLIRAFDFGSKTKREGFYFFSHFKI